MRRSTFTWILFLSAAESLGLLGCSDELGSHPFVPAKGYSCTVTISLPKEGVAGEWIELRATRTNGPWMQVDRKTVREGAVALPERPPGFEEQVAANLTWFTEPAGVAVFNVATIESAVRNPYDRQVMFSKPGVYKIWGLSAYPTVSTSAVETITIRATQ